VAVDEEIDERRVFFELEGKESKAFFRIVQGSTQADDPMFTMDEGEEFECERRMLPYESKFMKKVVLPQEPRLFCLSLNGMAVEYEDDDGEESDGGGSKS